MMALGSEMDDGGADVGGKAGVFCHSVPLGFGTSVVNIRNVRAVAEGRIANRRQAER